MTQKLKPELTKEIIDLLTPYLTAEERRAYIEPWCLSYPHLHKQIDWTGADFAFTNRTVRLFLRYGLVEPNKSALEYLFESVREIAGLGDRAKIDEILNTLQGANPYNQDVEIDSTPMSGPPDIEDKYSHRETKTLWLRFIGISIPIILIGAALLYWGIWDNPPQPIASSTEIVTNTPTPTPQPTPSPTATTSSIAAESSGDPTFSCTAVSEIPQPECEALVDIYSNTNGPNWIEKSGWLTTFKPCSWYGITCSNGSITALDLDNDDNGNRLSGVLPDTIRNLSNVTLLDLSHNQLNRIPAEIRYLSNLRILSFTSNQLSRVPAEIWTLSSLTDLYLAYNKLKNVPAEIDNLSNLKVLHLYSNQLSSLPAEIGNLNNLKILHISSNQLSSLPAEIGNLNNLIELYLYSNRLNRLPSEIGKLNNLTELWLYSNQLSSLPAKIGNLTNLETLDISENLLSELPAELINLAWLTELDVSQNHLVNVHPTLEAFLNKKDPDWADDQIVDISSTVTSISTITELGIGSTYVNPVDGATYVYVPAGDFIMGSENGSRDESPQHTVYLDAYWIMETEVTNAQYRKFIEAKGYVTKAYWSDEGWEWRGETTQPRYWDDNLFNIDQQPVVGISWYEAQAYANWLSAEADIDIGLPTEAEWEKAARGTDRRIYPWGNERDESSRIAPVGSYPAGKSPYGALDMAGNVWEWTADWYDSEYYGDSHRRNPVGPDSGDDRVMRSGAWDHDPYYGRVASRFSRPPNYEVSFNVGFRLMLRERIKEN